MTFQNLHEAELLARATLPTETYDYFAGGANDEVTLADNRRAFDDVALRYRVLVDVSRRDLSTTLFGQKLSAEDIKDIARKMAEATIRCAELISSRG